MTAPPEPGTGPGIDIGPSARGLTTPPGDPAPAMVVALIAQIAFGLIAMTICLPSMPDWGRAFGASTAAVQLSFSGVVLTYGGLQLV